MFHEIEVTKYAKLENAFSPGPAPQLAWLEIKDLVVDRTYQREIGAKGKINVRLIAEQFDWSKFAPVVVAPIEGGRFAIVDGQHRTTAAALRNLEKVPCQIILADQMKQAQAFAAVNGAITRTTAQQLHRANLAAGDEFALTLQSICDSAGVTLAGASKTSETMKPGETKAIGTITRCHRKYGRETLITSLQCITQTSDKNPGFLRGALIESLCIVLNRRHDWRDAGTALLEAMDDFNFESAWDYAMSQASSILSMTLRDRLIERIEEHLAARLSAPTERPAVERIRKVQGKQLQRKLAA